MKQLPYRFIMFPMERQQRKQHWNYRDYKLPHLSTLTKKGTHKELFSVEIIEEEDSRIKVHYIGYSYDYNKWKERSEIESLDQEEDTVPELPQSEAIATGHDHYSLLSLFDELRLKIKNGLSCNRKKSPKIKVAMPFDLVSFNGSLKLVGTPSKKIVGTQYYKLSNYQDLNHFLGPNWHYRGINENNDYDYVLKETFDFVYVKRGSLLNTCQVVMLPVVPQHTLVAPSVLPSLVDMVTLKHLVKI